MSTIPSKQLHRIGTNEHLEQNLSEREIGFSTTENRGYIKLNGSLVSLGGSTLPNPTQLSVLVGSEDGSYTWGGNLVKAPYDSTQDMWVSIGGKGILAEATKNDSEGHFIGSSFYSSPRMQSTYGSISISKQEASGFMKVSIRKGNADPSRSDSYIDLGGLIPLGGEGLATGDVLTVTGMYGTPSLAWKQPESTPVKGSNSVASSGSVYNVLYLIDPSLHAEDPIEKVIDTPADMYDVGSYYMFDGILFRCIQYSSATAKFLEVAGVIGALNEMSSGTPVFMAEYDVTSYTDILAALDNNSYVFLKVAPGNYAYYISANNINVGGQGSIEFRSASESTVYYRCSESLGWSTGNYTESVIHAITTDTIIPNAQFKVWWDNHDVCILTIVASNDQAYITSYSQEKVVFCTPVVDGNYKICTLYANGNAWDVKNASTNTSWAIFKGQGFDSVTSPLSIVKYSSGFVMQSGSVTVGTYHNESIRCYAAPDFTSDDKGKVFGVDSSGQARWIDPPYVASATNLGLSRASVTNDTWNILEDVDSPTYYFSEHIPMGRTALWHITGSSIEPVYSSDDVVYALYVKTSDGIITYLTNDQTLKAGATFNDTVIWHNSSIDDAEVCIKFKSALKAQSIQWFLSGINL